MSHLTPPLTRLCVLTDDMGLAVPYRPPERLKQVPLAVPFRVFQQYFSRKEHYVSHREFVAGLKRYPDAADSLGLMQWVKQSNAALQIFQLLFGVEEYNEEKRVTLGDLFRTFSGHELEDLGIQLPYARDEGPARPPLISAKAAIAAFHELGAMSSDFITHKELVDGMKRSKSLTEKLGFKKAMEDENGSEIIYLIMSAAHPYPLSLDSFLLHSIICMCCRVLFRSEIPLGCVRTSSWRHLY